jgi:carboxypeptidase C (cathepsin A)
VEQFALGDYTLALMQGAALPAETQIAIAHKLARYTGLSPDYVMRANLRLEIHRFCKELLRAEGRTVGRLDTRFTGVDRDAAGEYVEFDPSYAVIQGSYTATLNDYMRRELQFESDLPYEILTGRVRPWNYDPHQNRFVDVAETLRKAMSINPYLKVFIANGYYDLATPYLATRYTVNHLELAPSLQANVQLTYYEAGHMMYVHRPSLAQLKQDMAEWLATAVG